MTIMDTFNELIKQLSKEIQDKEGRTRSRTADEQIRFNYALTKILEDIWKNLKVASITRMFSTI